MGYSSYGGYFKSIRSVGFGLAHVSYFTCGLLGHYLWDYPCRGAIFSLALSVPPIIEVYPSAKDGSHTCRDSFQGTQGGFYIGRIGDQSGAQPSGRCGQLYVVPSRAKVETLNVVVIGTI